MTAGDSTFEGLAVPLYGESEIEQQDTDYDILTLTSATDNAADFFVIRNVDHSELLRIEDTGEIWQSITGGDNCNFRTYRTLNADSTGQAYAAQFLLDESTFAVGGGRHATLYLRFDCNGDGISDSGKSFINFEDHDTHVPAVFSFPNAVANDGGYFETITDLAITHGIVIYIGTTKYWLAVLNASA